MMEHDERRERAFVHRLKLIKEKLKDNGVLYNVLGTTGNVYSVIMLLNGVIDSCTCPDHQSKGNYCKHQYFIQERVLKTEKHENDIRIAIALSRLENKFFLIDDDGILAPEKVIQEYKKKRKRTMVERKSVKNRECPVCFESLEQDDVIYCDSSCGQPIHKKCFTDWTLANKSTCVYCRTDMYDDSKKQQSYINLEYAINREK